MLVSRPFQGIQITLNNRRKKMLNNLDKKDLWKIFFILNCTLFC